MPPVLISIYLNLKEIVGYYNYVLKPLYSVEHSVVMSESELIEIERMDESLIGRNVRVFKNKTSHKALRLMIGDDSVGEI